jgi:hypothetical protein
MIWFACSQCGKALSRPDSSAGAFVFCTCGQGNVVPWESTMAAPPEAPAPPQPPPLRPVAVDEEKIPVVRQAAPPMLYDLDEARARPGAPVPARNSTKCFNHQDRPISAPCEDCKEGFCADCLLRFQGHTLCGPCKNFRLRTKTKANTLSSKALIAVLLAMGSGPGVACLWPLGATGVVLVLCMLAILAQLAAVVLGGLALRETELNPRLGGRSLAITSMLTGGLAFVLTVCFMMLGPK